MCLLLPEKCYTQKCLQFDIPLLLPNSVCVDVCVCVCVCFFFFFFFLINKFMAFMVVSLRKCEVPVVVSIWWGIFYTTTCVYNWHGEPVSWCILWLQHVCSASIVPHFIISVWLYWIVNIAPPVDCIVLNLMEWCLCFPGQCFIVSGLLWCWVQEDFVFWILDWK